MQAIKKINNNVALCIDSSGCQVIAMGKGVGFGSFPRQLELSEIERTFYHVDDSYIKLLQDIPEGVLSISAEIIDSAQRMLPYAISRNSVLTMADHIQFAIERAEKNIKVQMPLAYEVKQQYPLEMEIAENALHMIWERLHVTLPKNELTGIAMNLVNARVGESESEPSEEDTGFEKMLDLITREAEDTFNLHIDRDSFHYARFAGHVYYLYQRLSENKMIDTENLSMYPEMSSSFPELAACVKRIADKLKEQFGQNISDEEQLYLMLHVNRICAKESI